MVKELCGEVYDLLTAAGITAFTGVVPEKPPKNYVIILPDTDAFRVESSNRPNVVTQSVLATVCCAEDWTETKWRSVKALLDGKVTVQAVEYKGFDPAIGRYVAVINALKPRGVMSFINSLPELPPEPEEDETPEETETPEAAVVTQTAKTPTTTKNTKTRGAK